MEKKWELGFRKTDAHSLKEQAARTVLRNVRAQGHPYVELREDNKKFIYFCTLCLSRCYSESVLFDHLKGNLHSERLAAAKVTLFGPNPWPFNDGVLFFDSSSENDKEIEVGYENGNGLLESNKNGSLAIVEYDERKHKKRSPGHVGNCVVLDVLSNSGCKAPDCDGRNGNLLIPNVLIKEEVSDLPVCFSGFGKITARFPGKDDAVVGISRIWCEWLGSEVDAGVDLLEVPRHDFAIVVFGYDYDLGRKGLFGDVKSLLSSDPVLEPESNRNGDVNGKRKRSLSDLEDMSGSLGNQYDSSGEDSVASGNSSPGLSLQKYGYQVLNSRIISSKAARRELRRHQRIAAEKMCDICQQKMLPGKDVSTLMNMNTGKLACSSRNLNGAFHVFHTSCLIQWVLLCESETATSKLGNPTTKRKSRRKKASSYINARKDGDKIGLTRPITSAFCPECQGTGIIVKGDNLENPSVPLSEMFRLKLRVSDARRAWMKCPELLQNCSVGFSFNQDLEVETQDKVVALKLLHFYGGGDWLSKRFL
ncbi:hypothetical protein MLD38_029302 [Melastoma candidum]|uniref:Uncharacterized protein n=1 Tax=Melastoma candidum TaxID=119954 RepID=A0ACB9N3J2_9MYRT|nr:hypothetical protein MLD38_029302 [Melastoma candidum]